MANDYYQDELLYLRESGREFARANPEAAKYLAEPGADPDVERLLEGVAFLTGRVRQKLDDELPELTHALLEALWPHYLRPLPAMTVLQFEATGVNQREAVRLPAGTLVDAVPVDGTACRFRTVYPVEVPPLRLERVEVEHGTPGRIRIVLKLRDGVSCARLGCDRLRLHLAGEPAVARALQLCLDRHVVRVEAVAGGARCALRLERVGFAPEEALLPFPGGSSSGFRHLQEYFAFPTKYQFVDVVGLRGLAALGEATAVTLELALDRVPTSLPPITAANLLIGCTPAVNLFEHDADPITYDRMRSEYRVRPTGHDPAHYEVHSVVRVQGLVRGEREPRTYHPLFHLGRTPPAEVAYYQERRRPALLGGGADHYLSLRDPPGTTAANESLSIQLLCTNRQLPAQLGIGDIRVATRQLPPGVAVRNLSVPTAAVSPVLAGDLHWRLLSHLTMNYSSVLDLAALRRLLGLYDLRALVDRHAEHAHQRLVEAIVAVRAEPATRLLDGVPIRGLGITIEVEGDRLGGVGEAHLLGAVLNEFVAQYVSLNAFTALSLKVVPTGDVLSWPPRLGRRALL